MNFYLHFSWLFFCIALGCALITSYLMNEQSKKFFLMHVVIRKFNIIDLEFPASAQELAFLIKDIFRLPEALSKKTIKALKGQLYIDFFFMPAIYGAVFVLSMKVSMKMIYFGHKLFAVFAWLQLVAWFCDIIENIYLLNKIRPEPIISKPIVQKAYDILEMVKWGIPLVTLVCSFAAIFYYWIVGKYSLQSLHYLIVAIVEILLFLILNKITFKTENQMLEEFQKVPTQ